MIQARTRVKVVLDDQNGVVAMDTQMLMSISILYCPLEIPVCKQQMHFGEGMQMPICIAVLHYD
jgi:hypothetical protein